MPAAVKRLREELRDARLLTLGPFEEVAQASSLVLIKGSLRASGNVSRHRQTPGHRSSPSGDDDATSSPTDPPASSQAGDAAPGDVRLQQQGDWHVKVPAGMLLYC